jgi:hypothetical protein
MIVPSSELLDVLYADRRGCGPTVQFRAVVEQGVPGEVQRTLDRLGSDLSHAAAGMHDGANQTGTDDRPTPHLADIVGRHGSAPPLVIEVGEPAVLEPSAANHLSCITENTGEDLQLGKSCAGLITQPQLSVELAPCAPGRATIVQSKGWNFR